MHSDLLHRSLNASSYVNSSYRQHDLVEGRPSAALLSTIPLTNPEEAAEVCSREDSAMRLGDERLSTNGARHTAISVFCQGSDTRSSSSSMKVGILAMAARAVLTLVNCCAVCADNANASNSWLQGTRCSSSRRRSFCRSSFTATRSYETRMSRQRRRTFAMPELEPTSNNNFQVILQETQSGMPEAAHGPTMRNTLLGMAASSWGKADHMMRSMMRSALHQSSEQAHACT